MSGVLILAASGCCRISSGWRFVLFCGGCYIIDFIVHVSSYFFQSTLHCSCFMVIFISPQFISFISPITVHLIHIYVFGCIHITWSFNHIVSFTFQPIPSLGVRNLRVSLNKFLILDRDRYSLVEAELRWFLLLLVSLCWAGIAWVFWLLCWNIGGGVWVHGAWG